ncbi:preprotein translocase subunit SecA [Chloroflexota bacterium]
MFKWLGRLIDSNEKELKRLQPIVNKINELEPEFERISDAELRAKTNEFKARLEDGTLLDELLPEAFAVVREAAKRTIGLRHFDVQLMGGIVLHQGKITEMKTGEGKTLVATLPLYLNSLTGQGCHLVTVNDYLARRDPYWMGPIYHALGVSVASIYPKQSPDEERPSLLYDSEFDSGDKRWPHFRPIPRSEAYKADIAYGTSSEFGFDYLRDNMVIDLSRYVQNELHYAIVDEVDNLLIDEARTPLIISGQAEDSGQMYEAINSIVSRMKVKVLPHEPTTAEDKDKENTLNTQYDYIAYEKNRSVKETERGQEQLARAFKMKVGDLFGSWENLTFEETRWRNAILSIFRQSMIAHTWYQRDREYMVNKEGEVVIVDEFTGRLMLGRRYSHGLHQAIEAKEHVNVRRESMTHATITVQNYFRMYDKLAGMTGTALTEAEEFHKIYNLDVVVIPTHKPMIRQDLPDQVYKDEEAKFKAVVREIEQMHKEERPVLVGTVSIENSEYLSSLLKRRGVSHQVLNAKYHEKEAGIIAQAGQPGAVTVATNMAGRGVDIILGGSLDGQDNAEWQKKHDKIIELGGLHIIGTERHEARRIDNQLRGRTGRQGDPGSSRFYVSLEDDVIHRFGGERIKGFMEWAGMDEDHPIENKLVNQSIETAQVRVEGYHFDMRKHLVEYDDVVNQQRELIYGERRKILEGADLKANILSMIKEELQGIVATHTADERDIDQNLEALMADVSSILPLPPELNTGALSQMKPQEIEDRLIEQAEALYEQREAEMGSNDIRVLERLIMLRTIDNLWREHLTAMDHMRREAGWQSLRQIRPVDAYKREGYKQFQILLDTIRHDVAHTVYHVGIVRKEARQRTPVMAQAQAEASGRRKKQLKIRGKKIGRNDPCPCGSGKKYKYCCGR